MTPKEKAIELVDKFHAVRQNPVKSSLIAVDLLISQTFLDFYVTHPKPFWQEVKTELEKL